MKKTKLLTLAWVLLIVSVFLTIVDVCCFDRAFYEKEYAKNETAEVIDISEEELMKVTNHLLDYLLDTEEDLRISAVIAGKDRNVFDERDTAHMVDVKVLYQNAMTVRKLCFAGALGLFVYVIVSMKKEALLPLASSYYKALGLFLAACAAVLIASAIDFDALWRLFHHIFFSNDLWLLDPAVSVLINMVPLQFFYDLVAKIVVMFVAFLAIVSTACLVVLRKGLKA